MKRLDTIVVGIVRLIEVGLVSTSSQDLTVISVGKRQGSLEESNSQNIKSKLKQTKYNGKEYIIIILAASV